MRLDFFTSPTISHNLVHPGEGTESAFDFHPNKFCYYPCNITQFLVCDSVSSGSEQFVVTFPPEY